MCKPARFDAAQCHKRPHSWAGRTNFLNQANKPPEQYANLTLEAPNNNPVDVAKILYAMLRQADDLGCAQVLFEKPSINPEWEVVIDRSRRAAA